MILSLWICAPSNGNAGIGILSTRIPGQSTVHLSFVNLQSTPITFLMASLSHLLFGSNLLVSRTLNTPSAFPMKHSARLFRIPKQIPNLYLGFFLFMGSVEICFANSVSPNGTNYCVVFRMPSSRHDLFDMGQDASSMLHNYVRKSDSSVSGSCVLHSMWQTVVRMIPRISITAFSMNPFDSLSPFIASYVVT